MNTRALALLASALAVPAAAQTPAWPQLPRYEPMAIPDDNPMSAAKVALGRRLFFDTRLSGNGQTSCASCHQPERGFTSDTGKGRSCPTLWNIGYHAWLGWDGANTSLERAAFNMWRFRLAPAKEGPGSAADVAVRLDEIPTYRTAFHEAFEARASVETVPRALAAFLRTLVAERSAWTRFRTGETTALSAAAREGWALFDGKARCTTCHNGALLTDQQFHNVGIGLAREKPDLGRFTITREERDHGAFKTPTLLNVARSAPYFHDGSAATLEEAVDRMAGGGIANPHLDGALAPRALTPREKAALVAFLNELTVDYDEVPEAE
jgi:cytochrome c peroxidase